MLGDRSRVSEGEWVATLGHYVGNFTAPLWGVPPSGKLVFLRCGEFYRLDAAGQVEEAYILPDLLDLMRQAGCSPVPHRLGTEMLFPGPATHDGVLPGHRERADASAALVEAMLTDLRAYDPATFRSAGQTGEGGYWHPDMLWFGPGGVGANFTYPGFDRDHRIPFLTAFPDRVGGNHFCRFGDGDYVCSGGWPSMTMTHRGPYLGVAATGPADDVAGDGLLARGGRQHPRELGVARPARLAGADGRRPVRPARLSGGPASAMLAALPNPGTGTMTQADPQRWADTHRDDILGTLRRFAAIPTVSTDPAYAADIERGAAFLADEMRGCGLEHVAVRPTAGHPVVTADWLHAPGRPTILVYAHYDVQPPEPLDKWTLAAVRARRCATAAFMPAACRTTRARWSSPWPRSKALMRTRGALPVNVKLLVEGEEEMGSANLDAFVAAHAAELAADFVLSADGAMWRVDLPTVTVASRGMCGLELTRTRRGQGPAFRPARRLGRQPAAGDQPAARQPAPRRRRRGGGRLLRWRRAALGRNPAQHGGDPVRRGRVSPLGRRPVRRRRGRLDTAGTQLAAPHPGAERVMGRLYRGGVEDRDPGRGARQDHLPPGAGPGPGCGPRRDRAAFAPALPAGRHASRCGPATTARAPLPSAPTTRA